MNIMILRKMKNKLILNALNKNLCKLISVDHNKIFNKECMQKRKRNIMNEKPNIFKNQRNGLKIS